MARFPATCTAALCGAFVTLHSGAMAQDATQAAEGTAAVQSTGTPGQSPFVIDQVTVYATREERAALDVPANVAVISGEQVEREMITDVQELVRYQPGIDVNRQTTGTDPFNTFGGFTIRGVGGNRVQMVVDGSRVPERIIDGTRDFIDLDFTKNVEIVRGPGSVLWGSDALGGIVAVETLDPEDVADPDALISGRASANYDSFDNGLDTSFTVAATPNDKIAVLAGLSYDVAEEGKLGRARADGGIYGCPRNIAYGATPCNELDPTDYRSTRGLGKIVLTPWDDHRIELSADYLQRDTEVDYNQVLGPVFSTITGAPTGEVVHGYERDLDLTRQRYALEHQWEVGSAFLDRVETTIAYAPQGYERSGVRRATNAAGEDVVEEDFLSYQEDFLELDVQARSSFALGPTRHTLTYGFDGDYTTTDYERIDRDLNLTTGVQTEQRAGGFNFANAETTRADLYIQDQIDLFGGRLELLPGARLSHYSIEPTPNSDYSPVVGKEPREVSATNLSLKFGATFHLNDNFSLYAQYAEGFKMPTAQQLYTSLPGAFFNLIPAPDLEPEEVTNYEIGLRGRFRQGAFSVNGFYADYTNFIQSFYNPPGTSDYTYRNLSEVKVHGIEASAEAALTDEITVRGALSWQQGDQKVDSSAPETPFDVAPLSGTLGVNYRPDWHPNLSLDVIGTFAAKTTRTSSDDLFKAPGYAVFDAFASYDLTDTVRLTGGVLNLTDARYFRGPFPNTYSTNPSTSVARSNPLELQTEPGRTFRIGLDVLF